MQAFRASAVMAAGLSLAALAAPVQAQVADNIVLDILRQCARIDDATARLACYDNNIRSAGASTSGQARSAVPGATARPQGGAAPLAGPSGAAGGFGSEDVRTRTPDRFEAPASEASQLTARVSAVSEREPGIYLLTLEDGAQWVFGESVSMGYRVPRAGSTVSIERAALGSYLMVFDNQRSVRIRRMR